MTPITFYDATVPNEIRWALMFMYGAFNNLLSAIPDRIQICASFGFRTVDASSLSTVRSALQGIKVKPKRRGSFHLDKLFKLTLEDSTTFRPSRTLRVNDLTTMWGPVKLHPYANWMSLVSEYVAAIFVVKELNIGLLQYEGEPGVLVTFEDGSSALFCPDRVISPFEPDLDLEIYPAYPVVKQGYTFEPLPVITTMGEVMGELDQRYRDAVILLVLSTAAPNWQAYVYDRDIYWRTDRGLYSLPREVQPTPDGKLAPMCCLRDNDDELYVVTSTDSSVKVTPAMARDALDTINLLNLEPVHGEVAQRLRRLADCAISILNGMTA